MNSDVLEIVRGLLEKSKKDEVKWVHASQVSQLNVDGMESSLTDDYAVSTQSFTINIYKLESRGNGEIQLNFHNSFGDSVTVVSALPGDFDYEILEKVLNLAAKYVKGEELLLKTILKDLKAPRCVRFRRGYCSLLAKVVCHVSTRYKNAP